jgi:hypothetical protein
MVFVSNDKFHREMWRVTSGVNGFVWCQDLKDDLRRRLANREKKDESAGDATKKEESSNHVAPPSVISEMWRTYMRVTDKSDQSGRAKTFEDLDLEIQEQFKEAMKQFDRMDRSAGKS